MSRYIDADALKKRMLSYYDCVNENTAKENYRGETLMNYEVADMIEDCIDNAPAADVVPREELEKAKQEADRLAVELEAEKVHKKVQKELYEKEIRGLVSYVGDLMNKICVMIGAEIVPTGDCAKIIKKYTKGGSSRAPTPTDEDKGGVSDG